MSFLFGRNRQKTPQDLVRAVRESISRMDVHLERRRVSPLLPLPIAIMVASIRRPVVFAKGGGHCGLL